MRVAVSEPVIRGQAGRLGILPQVVIRHSDGPIGGNLHRWRKGLLVGGRDGGRRPIDLDRSTPRDSAIGRLGELDRIDALDWEVVFPDRVKVAAAWVDGKVR